MPGCVFHVSGVNFNADSFLAESDLRPYRVHRRGEIGRRSKQHSDSGFSLDVSDADGDLAAEIADAINFLSKHEAELTRLRSQAGVSDMRLDFGYYRRDVFLQCDYLPPELLARAGGLSIGIELSLYPIPKPELRE